MDRDQPGRLLLRAPRPLRDHRPVQPVDGIYGAWGRRGLIAYGVGFAGRDPVHGPARPRRLELHRAAGHALNGVDIAWIVGLIVSGGVYWLLTRSLDVESERRAEAISAGASWWRCREGAGPAGRRRTRGRRAGDLPEPVGDQVRVRLTASGVCHSDLHAFNGEWTVPLPLVLGHEGAGVVEAVGPDVRDVVGRRPMSCCRGSRRAAAARACAVGRRVAVQRHARARAPVGDRRRCTAYLGLGTFAEATIVPESAVIADRSSACRRRSPR